MFQNIGFTELLLIAVVALVLFGPQKLPEIGRMLGKTLRDFKQAANELMKDDPKATQASKAPITPSPSTPIAPDPVTPVSIAGIAVADSQGETSSEEPMAATEPTPQVQGSMNAETAVEPTSSPAVKPAVAFVTNKSSEVIQVAGSPIESAEALASSAVPSASQAAPDVLSAAPAQVSAPTPAPAQQPGSTSNSRRLPD